MPIPAGTYSQGPSCLDKITRGFLMGLCVGITSGALLGGFSAFRAGFRGKELIRGTGKSIMQYGVPFSLFMAIGGGIRC